MAKVSIRVYATTREIFPHGNIETEGETVIEVLRKLVEKFPDIKDEILDENLDLGDRYIYLLNGRNVNFMKSGETRLENGDTISVFPPVTGG